MNESTISKNIAKLIRNKGGWARKIAGGPHSAGLPDILACYRGHFIGLETKMPGKEGTLTTNQRLCLDAIKAGGGVAIMVVSTHDVERILNRIDALYG